MRGYLSALPIAIKREQERLLYRTYVTDSLKVLLDVCGSIGQGNRIEFPRWADQLEGGRQQPVETRTAEEIIEQTRQRLREVSG